MKKKMKKEGKKLEEEEKWPFNKKILKERKRKIF
jgi:hypothetical protein